jgi:hypothetical protein
MGTNQIKMGTFYFFLILLARSFISASQLKNSSENEGIKALDPENDPIYDPNTGSCYYQNSDKTTCLSSSFDDSLTSSIVSPLSANSFSPYSPQSQNSMPIFDFRFDSYPTPPSAQHSSLNFVESGVVSSQITSSTESQSVYPHYSRSITSYSMDLMGPGHNSISLHVPEACKHYDRMWDFYVGGLESFHGPIGWISRIGYANNVIRDLQLNMRGTSYTLIPSGKSVENIIRNISLSRYLQIGHISADLFVALYNLSAKIDKRGKTPIMALTISFDYSGSHSIRIFVDPGSDYPNNPAFSIRNQLISIGIPVSGYFP